MYTTHYTIHYGSYLVWHRFFIKTISKPVIKQPKTIKLVSYFIVVCGFYVFFYFYLLYHFLAGKVHFWTRDSFSLYNVQDYITLQRRWLIINKRIRAPVADWSKVLGFYRFATSAPGLNFVRPAKNFHRIFRVLECTSTTLSSRCSIGRLF
jgi:hypothetical protein